MRRAALVVASLLALVGASCTPTAAPLPTATPATTSGAAQKTPATPPSTQPPTSSSRGPSSSATAPASVHVAAAGDFGSTAETDAVLRAVNRSGASALLMIGDLSYGQPGAEQQWCDWTAQRLPEVRPVVLAGNHDAGPNGLIDNFVRCLPRAPTGVTGEYGRQYAFEMPASKPLVRFVMISPGLDFGAGELDYSKGSPGYDWTRNQIRDARADGIPFVVVGMHEPCMSIGLYGCASGADLMNLLISERVDLVLHGHEHLYQRSKQLTNHVAGCQNVKPKRYNKRCVADSDAKVRAGQGTVFVTVGTGGTKLRAVHLADREARYFVRWSATNAQQSHGFVNLVATRTSLTLTFDNAGTGRSQTL